MTNWWFIKQVLDFPDAIVYIIQHQWQQWPNLILMSTVKMIRVFWQRTDLFHFDREGYETWHLTISEEVGGCEQAKTSWAGWVYECTTYVLWTWPARISDIHWHQSSPGCKCIIELCELLLWRPNRGNQHLVHHFNSLVMDSSALKWIFATHILETWHL